MVDFLSSDFFDSCTPYSALLRFFFSQLRHFWRNKSTLLQSGANGLTATLAPEEIRLTVLGMSALIGANIIATFAFHIANPENIERIEAHFAEWQIDQAIRKAKTEAAQSIAGEIAQREAEAYAIAQKAKDRSDKTQDERTAAEVLRGILGKTKRDALPLAAAETVQAKLKQTSPKVQSGESIK